MNLLRKTIEMGYRGVAITDHSGCQAFPISFGIIKSHNKNVRKKINEAIDNLEEQIKNEEDSSIREKLESELKAKQEEKKESSYF